MVVCHYWNEAPAEMNQRCPKSTDQPRSTQPPRLPSTYRQEERVQQTRGPQKLVAQLNLKYERKIKKSSFLAPHYLLNQRGVLRCGHVAVLLLLVAQLGHLWERGCFVPVRHAAARSHLHPPPSPFPPSSSLNRRVGRLAPCAVGSVLCTLTAALDVAKAERRPGADPQLCHHGRLRRALWPPPVK